MKREKDEIDMGWNTARPEVKDQLTQLSDDWFKAILLTQRQPSCLHRVEGADRISRMIERKGLEISAYSDLAKPFTEKQLTYIKGVIAAQVAWAEAAIAEHEAFSRSVRPVPPTLDEYIQEMADLRKKMWGE